MLPILNIPKSITNVTVFIFFFLFILFVPVYGQSCGTIFYGTADGDLLNGAQCTAGLQTPSISKECASCNVKNMPGFRDFFIGSGMGNCNNLQIMNYWVHGGIGPDGPRNFYYGDIGPGICKCACACELSDHNADCSNEEVATVPTIKPTLIPTRIPTIPLIPTTISTPTVAPIRASPTAGSAGTNFNVSSLNINVPIQNNVQDNTPKITFPKINIKENLTNVWQFFTSMFTRFFQEASF